MGKQNGHDEDDDAQEPGEQHDTAQDGPLLESEHIEHPDRVAVGIVVHCKLMIRVGQALILTTHLEPRGIVDVIIPKLKGLDDVRSVRCADVWEVKHEVAKQRLQQEVDHETKEKQRVRHEPQLGVAKQQRRVQHRLP